jgi:radical SAM superfamily enzyme YgiQ (UPF0313 family)
LDKGYNVRTVIPECLSKYLPRTKALGISVQDPLGEAFGPIYIHMFCLGRRNSRIQYQRLVRMPAVQRARKDGVKVIVGGPGSWQLKQRMKGVDCTVGGEAERILPMLLDRVRADQPLPKTIDCHGDLIPRLKDVSPIKAPTQFGFLQVGRGCLRRCKFCTVSGKPFWFPLDHIERSVKVNAKAGLEHSLLLSEDLLVYGSNSVVPKPDKFNKLITLMARYSKFISLSHYSVSAIIQEPTLFTEIHHHWPEEQEFAVAQTGIETGSERVLKKMSPAKKAPFKDRPWRDMVIESADILEDSKVFPYYTVLIGGPFEEAKDMQKTLDLLDEIKDHGSLMMPCIYTSGDRPQTEVKDLMELEKQMIGWCLRHNLKWYKKLSDGIIGMYPANRWIRRRFRDFLYNMILRRLKKRFKQNDCDLDLEKIPEIRAPTSLRAPTNAHQDSI